MQTIIQLLQGVRLDADLTLEAPNGILICKSSPDGVLSLDFSNEATFRFFLQSLRKAGFSFLDQLKLSDQISSLPYPIEIKVNGTTYLKHLPGTKLQLDRWQLFRQALLQFFGR